MMLSLEFQSEGHIAYVSAASLLDRGMVERGVSCFLLKLTSLLGEHVC